MIGDGGFGKRTFLLRGYRSVGEGRLFCPLPQRCHFASISLPRGFHKDRISARSVLKCFPFETRARLKNNAPATISRGRPQCTACFWKCTNLSLSLHNNDMGLPDGRCSRIRPGTVPSSVFHLFRGILFLQNINFIFYFQYINIHSFQESYKKQKLYLKKNFNFIIIFSWTTRKQAVSRLQSNCCREIGTEAGKWLARLPSRMPIPPPRKQSFGIRQRNFLIHGCFSASRVLIAFSSPKERECKDKTVSSWSTS